MSTVWYHLYSGHKAAPNVSFRTITNQQIELKKLQGQIVLITFWASNCATCIKEIPDFISLYNDYHQSGLEIIAIAVFYDRPNYVVNTSKMYQIPYHVTLDLKNELATAFGDVSLTPTTILIDSSGHIVYKKLGSFNLNSMHSRIQSLLPPSS